MSRPLRAGLLFAAAALMLFAAIVSATISVPHLREDMLEIHVRSTLLAAVLVALSFGTLAMFGFTLIVIAAALQSLRNAPIDRISLGIIAAVYAIFGITAFAWIHSRHSLGYVAVAALLAIAIFVSD